MAERDLPTFLEQKFGLKVAGAKPLEVVNDFVDNDPSLKSLEEDLVQKIKTNGFASLPLNTKRAVEFAESLGAASMMRLAAQLMRPDQKPYQFFATITPDTNYRKDTLRFAFLGRRLNQQFWIPEHLDPLSGKANMQDVELYLSAANQLSTVGEHNASQKISVADPRHLLNAMEEHNLGSFANRLIQNTHPDNRSHIGDEWEKQRSMLPNISAQDPASPKNDLIWSPVSFTPLASTSKGLPLVMVFTKDLLDQQALDKNNKLIPLGASKPGALEEMQLMGYATLLRKGQTDNLARSVEKGMV